MQDFWDLDFAYKSVQGGLPYVRGLRKPEAVAALRALVRFVQLLPNGAELLEEVRALAGRRPDGLDKMGGADHVCQALQEQRGIRPFMYTAALREAGVPQAPPPRPGQQAAHSYRPASSLQRASLQRLTAVQKRLADKREAAAAAVVLALDSQALVTQEQEQSQGAQGRDSAEAAAAARELLVHEDQEDSQDNQEGYDSVLFSGLGSLLEEVGAAGATDGGLQDWADKVSDPNDASNHVLISTDIVHAVPQNGGGTAVPQVGGGPEAVPPIGGLGAVPRRGGGTSVHAPVKTGPLVAEGDTLGTAKDQDRGTQDQDRGRNEVDQSQDQAGAQAQGTSAEGNRPRRRAVCPAIRKGNFCVDKSC